MRTYCKHLVVSDEEKIYESITDYMHDKYRKNSSIRFFACYSGKSRNFVRENFKPGTDFFDQVHRKLAKEMAEAIRNRAVREHLYEHCYGQPLIRYEKINDRGSGKERILGLETVLFRLYETVAQKASDPLFKAKVGRYQCASIKKRGQNYGKKAVRKWMSKDVDGTRYYAKADVHHCYPSIEHKRLSEFLHRDLRKCPELLYLYDLFLQLYDENPNPEGEGEGKGILIGSPVSKDLCNYFLSRAYHYASEHLVKTVTRRGKTKTVRLISHIIFYMDDIVMYGSNKKDLHLAVKLLSSFMEEELGLSIKPSWFITKIMFEDKKGKSRGNILDYMGFQFHGGKVRMKSYYGRDTKHRKVWVTIREGIFLHARQNQHRLAKMLRKKEKVPRRFAMTVTSNFGWYKNTNSIRHRRSHRVDKLVRIARKIVGDYAKGKAYDAEKYYKMWRRLYA